MRVNELREMSDEQLELTAKDAADQLFRLRVKAQTEKVKATSEKKLHRQVIARVRTLQTQRAKAKG